MPVDPVNPGRTMIAASAGVSLTELHPAVLGLTRFGGHPESLARGAADAKNTSTVFAGVRRQMVDLVRAGRNPDDLAREFEPSGHSIRAWVAQADRNEGRREEAAPGLTAFERDELTRLRRENKQLRLERDILSKAAAWFARETGTLPSGSSGS